MTSFLSNPIGLGITPGSFPTSGLGGFGGFSSGPSTFDAAGSLFSGGGGGAAAGASMFDPVSLGLFAVSTGVQAFSGMSQANSANRLAMQQMAAADRNAQLNREAMKDAARIQQQENERNRQAMYGWGADLDFARQKEATMLDTGLFGERRLNLANKEKIFNQALANSPDAKEKARFDNELAIQRAIAERTAVMEGMFGPIRRA